MKNPSKNDIYERMLGLRADMIADEIIFNRRKYILEGLVDTSLLTRNYENFIKYSKELNELLNR